MKKTKSHRQESAFSFENEPRRLLDPCNDRVVKDLPLPYIEHAGNNALFNKEGIPNWNLILNF